MQPHPRGRFSNAACGFNPPPLLPPCSSRLAALRPIVILNPDLPEAGTAWEEVARLSDVWFVQVGFRAWA